MLTEPEAQCKSIGGVQGDDEQSTQMAASWEDEKVTEASSNSFVAIKIDTKSFFIGDSGIPLEVIAGSVSADELVTRIHKVRQREIKKEIERRKTGKEMLDYKRKQEEELTKRMLEERNREKAEDRAARERIKQQIALDRAERAARFAKTKEEVEAAKAAALLTKQAEMEIKRDSSTRERSTVARIQFRLPDGSSFTNQFPSDAPLEEARQFAAQAGFAGIAQ
ncbi:hypothetical protein CB1_000226002 [Camelus ferus]|nr:hypothetical protein CB1_000226002 [Camelus ferus]